MNENFGPEKITSLFPVNFTGTRHLPKTFFGCFIWNKVVGIGALLVQTRQPRQYMVRTSIANMRENEVTERYRLFPERIQWLVALLEDKLERDRGRNFPVSAETQVSVVKLVNSILCHSVRRADLPWIWKQNFFVSFIRSLQHYDITLHHLFWKYSEYHRNFQSKRKSLCSWCCRVSLWVGNSLRWYINLINASKYDLYTCSYTFLEISKNKNEEKKRVTISCKDRSLKNNVS